METPTNEATTIIPAGMHCDTVMTGFDLSLWLKVMDVPPQQLAKLTGLTVEDIIRAQMQVVLDQAIVAILIPAMDRIAEQAVA